MHWHCDMQSAEAVQPSWPLLPETAMVLQPKDSAKGQLLQEEIAVWETMGAKRQLDFTSGRCCAHIAQALLGLQPNPILRADRAPIWPKGQCGSISHSKHWALAAVSTHLRSVGVDVEHVERVTPRLHETLFRPEELEALNKLPATASAIAFSAKEAGYKAIFPIGARFIGFQEASIQLDWQRQEFHIRYHGAHGPNKALESGLGHWRLLDQHVITFFAI